MRLNFRYCLTLTSVGWLLSDLREEKLGEIWRRGDIMCELFEPDKFENRKGNQNVLYNLPFNSENRLVLL